MALTTATPEDITRAYSRICARGLKVGDVNLPSTWTDLRKPEAAKTLRKSTVRAAIVATKSFSPASIAASLETDDGEPVTPARIVKEWVRMAFDPERAAGTRMRALEKVERYLVAVAAAHPLIAEEIDGTISAARNASRKPSEELSKQVVESTNLIFSEYTQRASG